MNTYLTEQTELKTKFFLGTFDHDHDTDEKKQWTQKYVLGLFGWPTFVQYLSINFVPYSRWISGSSSAWNFTCAQAADGLIHHY